MENRQKIVQEFLSLRVKLNKANHIADEPTEISFRIKFLAKTRSFCFEAFLLGPGKTNFLILCLYDKKELWQEGRFSGFPFLENYFVNKLNALPKNFYPSYNTETSRKNVDEILVELRGLGIHLFK